MKKENILEILAQFQKESGNRNPYLNGYHPSFYSSEPDLNDFKGFISEPWIVGGRSGGNCWNDRADINVEIEDSKDIILLDKFLEQYIPKISFLQYKKLTRLIKHQEWRENEYYGNYNNYKCAYIFFEDIADCLSKIEI